MAKFTSTTFGAISGKHGTAVAVLKSDGTNYLRVHRNPANPRTDKQTAQRNKFAFSANAIRPFHNLFKETMGGETGLSRGRKHAFRNAISGEYPNFSVDYENLKISSGSVDLPEFIATMTNGALDITWTNDESLNSRDDDSVCVVFYNESSKLIVHNTDVTVRSEESVVVEIPSTWSGSVKCWAYMQQGGSTSDSIFLGEIDAIKG